MIHRIEPGYLRTNDALNKRDRRQGRRRHREAGDDGRDEHAQDVPVPHGEESESVCLDLVA